MRRACRFVVYLCRESIGWLASIAIAQLESSARLARWEAVRRPSKVQLDGRVSSRTVPS